ncbi:V-set and immunoglobulin domain-containing protein 1-like [Sparus aurata]|uniref:V-set and immunoglobulin domain-containing protein 1-like n=1 Tax=Sparus aurata TaxID=8175 RepID=UPI0011C1CDD8|nr:V-set and immunoglobulin domain-containing protein 1-like [Sparus aurata]
MADVTALTLSSSLHFISVSVGEPVTLECSYEDGLAIMLYWYKQAPGQKPQPLSKLYRHSKNATLFGEFVNDPRLQLESTPGKHLLKISYVQSSDAGTYFCIGGSSFIFNFLEGIVIHVKSPGLNIPASVHQSASEIIQPGGSLTLNCTVHTGTCDGEHSVYWFKHSQESHPGVIYTHGGRNDQCERKDNTQTHTCVYNVSIKSLNLSHAGTYYCAVASCGHILFGNGTTLDFEDDEDSPVLVHILSGALAFTIILVVLLAYTTYIMHKRKSTAPSEEPICFFIGSFNALG